MTYTIHLATGIVTRDSDGVQVAPGQSIDDPVYLEYVNWVANGNYPTEVADYPQHSSRKITKLAFRNRFQTSEKVALELASLDDPTAAMSVRQQKAALRVYLKDLDNASFVDLERQDTKDGVNALVPFGILTAARAASILNDPIQPSEVPV